MEKIISLNLISTNILFKIKELSKPKVIDNSDKYLKEINDLKDLLA